MKLPSIGDGVDHYVKVPRYMIIVRLVQSVFAILLFALIIHPTDKWTGAYGGAPDALPFNLFTAIWTFIVLAYALVIPLKFPKYWNKWASLGLEIVTWIFWLTAFALLADFTRKSAIYGKHNYSGIYKRSAQSVSDYENEMELNNWSNELNNYAMCNAGNLISDSGEECVSPDTPDLSSSFGSSGGSSSGGDFSGFGGSSSGFRSGGGSVKSGVTPWWALSAVCSAVSALGWVLWSFSLITYGIAMKGEFAGSGATAAVVDAEAGEAGGEKYAKAGDVEMNTQTVTATPQ